MISQAKTLKTIQTILIYGPGTRVPKGVYGNRQAMNFGVSAPGSTFLLETMFYKILFKK
jgi:hypothetical protein